MIVQLYIKVYSFHSRVLNKFNSQIKRTLGKYTSLKNPVSFPIKTKKFTVLRSPHIDKKSREQFELCTYTNLYVVKSEKDIEINNMCNSLKKKAFAGIGLSFKKEISVIL